MLSQLTPTPAAAAVLTACIAGAVAITKKLLPGKDHVSRSEFHQALDSIRDRIDAVYTRIDALASSIHDRLNHLDAAVARLDERTKKNRGHDL